METRVCAHIRSGAGKTGWAGLLWKGQRVSALLRRGGRRSHRLLPSLFQLLQPKVTEEDWVWKVTSSGRVETLPWGPARAQ